MRARARERADSKSSGWASLATVFVVLYIAGYLIGFASKDAVSDQDLI